MTYDGGPSCNYTYDFEIQWAPDTGYTDCDPEIDEDCVQDAIPELVFL